MATTAFSNPPSQPSAASTPPPLPSPRSGRRCRPRRRLIAALAALSVATGGSAARACYCYDPVIFDPSNYAQGFQQLVQTVGQVAQARQAVANGMRMAARWGYGQVDGIGRAVRRLEDVLGSSDVYRTNPEDDLGDRYPTNYGAAPSPEAFVASEAAWDDAERQALVENRRVQNEVARDVAPAASRITAMVEASNGAEGETAAAQAHVGLLAETSGGLSKLGALKVARARLRAERQARQQSDTAYRDARRDWLMRDWETPAGVAPVDMPFGG